MDKKFEVYICTGCGIGETLDVDGLSDVAGEYKMTVKAHEAFCSEAGRQVIKDDMANHGVNTAVICACSPRVWQNEFSFGEGTITVRANLREGVVWSREKPGEQRSQEVIDEFTNELAQDYVRMACAQAKKIETPVASQLEVTNRRILVMGGGLAGLTAAWEAAKAGQEVLLVEKAAKLGGKALGWRKQLPTKAPWSGLEESTIQELISAVQTDSRITIKTSTEVARVGGVPGDFQVTLKVADIASEWDAPSRVTVDVQEKIDKGQPEDPNVGLKGYAEVNPDAEKVGAIVLATGWVPAGASEFEHLGHGKLQKVLTNAEFEKLAKEGKVPASVAFIQSPGGAEHDRDFPYANSVTSMVALKQATYVCEDNPDGKAYVLYQHMRTPGNMEIFYKESQNNDGIFLTKGAVTAVEKSGDGLVVRVKDTLLQEDLDIQVDMVVLGAGMKPTTALAPTINMSYRQGPAFLDLELFDGYADSNFICFPYETRRTGIYACGGVRKATDMLETIDDACGAALKAIQCIESTDRGVAVHPRSGDLSCPEFYFQRCTQCKRCTEECPFGALDDDDKGTPLLNPTRCRRCGTCMGACPERIISFKNYSIDMIGSMVKAVEVPDDDEDKLRFMVFVCENDAYPALDMAALRKISINSLVRVIPVRCLGSVNMVWIKDALSAGMDGVLLLGCKFGDDYQCHFVKGSEIADKRMLNIGETLGSLGLEPERCAVRQVAITDYATVSTVINEFVEEVQELGPNPFKGF